MTLWRKKLFELLEDGEVHDLEEIVQLVARAVPPERGYRKTLSVRNTREIRRGKEPEKLGEPRKGDMWRSGQRRIARELIRTQAKAGKLVVENGKIWKIA